MDQQRNTKRLKHILSSTYKTRQGLKKSVKRKPSWTQEYLLVVWARWSEQPTQCNQALLTRPSRAMKRHYNQRIIEVEHGSFSPLVFSPYGGNSREAEWFLTELAVKRSQKKKMDYSIGIHWLWAILIKISSVMCKRLQNNQIWVEHWF